MSVEPWFTAVVIPARNEQESIGDCIRSVLTAATVADCLSRLWIVVVADSCRDATAGVAQAALESDGEVVACSAASAGTARRLGAAAALARFRRERHEHIWLLNTDADSTVPSDWIAEHLKYAERGMTGVAGIVSLEESASELARQFHQRTYKISSDGSHEHVHGANMALRADAYLDVGGWYDRTLAEDHCLWQRLRAKGWRVCSPATSVVITSARLAGRAPGGFADTLQAGIHAIST